MKTVKKILMVVFCLVLSASLLAGCAGCGNNNQDIPDDGRPSATTTVVKFWGWGDETEVGVFKELVDKFNKENGMNIEVRYTQKPSDGYDDNMQFTLNGSSAPDVFYVGDGKIKTWADLGFLRPIDDYVNKSEVLNVDDIWPTALQRYRYNVDTTTSLPTDPLYGLPKDIGPTVIYYNADAFASVGVTVISLNEADVAGFNDGTKNDALGKSKADYGITSAVPASGYFELDGKKIFNNKIAMTWEESVELSKLLTKSYNASSPTDYGYFTEWWFSYGWSVGGNCIEMDADGNWKFTLGDTTKNYKVNEGQSLTVGGATYNAGEIVSYLDKSRLTADDKAKCVELPSIKEAFTEFCRLSASKNFDVSGEGDYGYAVTPNPNTISTDGKVGYFTNRKVAMLVDGRWTVTNLRKNAKFNWDVAPLPKHKDGIEAGHSGSMALGMWSKTKVPNAAYKFIEFIASETGQAAQAATGFNIPNQKSLAATDVFLQPDQSPKNAEIFLRAAEVQKAGDWAFLRTSEWIDEWAGVLNNDVRNGNKTLNQFFNEVTARTNKKLLEYTN